MQNYKILIQYDGTHYSGWQKQKNTLDTIQGRFERILSQLNGGDVEISGSGRTDAGVHAIGQVANFKLHKKLDKKYVFDYLNKYLPDDIAVTDIDYADDRFHARLNAKRKTYVYRMWIGEYSNVFEHRFLYTLRQLPDIEKMKTAANLLTGRHDFFGFSSVKKTKKSTVREIYKIEIKKNENEIKIIFEGNGFLYNMVRILAGTIYDCGIGKMTCDSIKTVFETGQREYAGETLPPCGLTLLKVEY
jgi:tRNA pseudouridine38-40 synthase